MGPVEREEEVEDEEDGSDCEGLCEGDRESLIESSFADGRTSSDAPLELV